MNRIELLRLGAEDVDKAFAILPGIGECSYVIVNPLQTALYIWFGSGPDGVAPDLIVPGWTQLTYPVGDEAQVTVRVHVPYTPGSDPELMAIVSVTTADMKATLGAYGTYGVG